jgi:hypothetical protein
MTTLTAMTTNASGDFIPVFCKEFVSDQGVDSREITKRQLKLDHPSLVFKAWVWDLEADKNWLNALFLSPEVLGQHIWAFTTAGIEQVTINRDIKII